MELESRVASLFINEKIFFYPQKKKVLILEKKIFVAACDPLAMP